jgi:hypothetical protein
MCSRVACYQFDQYSWCSTRARASQCVPAMTSFRCCRSAWHSYWRRGALAGRRMAVTVASRPSIGRAHAGHGTAKHCSRTTTRSCGGVWNPLHCIGIISSHRYSRYTVLYSYLLCFNRTQYSDSFSFGLFLRNWVKNKQHKVCRQLAPRFEWSA